MEKYISKYRLRMWHDGTECGETEWWTGDPRTDEKIARECTKTVLGWEGERNPHGDIFYIDWELWAVDEESGEEERVSEGVEQVLTPADHENLIREASRDAGCVDHCGDDPDDHEWQPHGGGRDENPGEWDLGGTSRRYVSRCTQCGLLRTEINWGWQRNEHEPDSVEYEFEHADQKEAAQ